MMIGVPMYDASMSMHTHLTLLNAALYANGEYTIEYRYESVSALPWCFNKLLARAAASDVDYFVMIHSDIGSKDREWLNKLIKELQESGLSVLSAVSPIKTNEGLTSTAVDAYPVPRRLTLTELHGLDKKTFTNKECVENFGKPLLINTGMMIWDMAKMRPWVYDLPFEFHDRWRTNGEGLVPSFVPEDWLMSRRLNERDIPYGATLKIPVVHMGHCDFTTDEPWGLPTDPQFGNVK